MRKLTAGLMILGLLFSAAPLLAQPIDYEAYHASLQEIAAGANLMRSMLDAHENGQVCFSGYCVPFAPATLAQIQSDFMSVKAALAVSYDGLPGP